MRTAEAECSVKVCAHDRTVDIGKGVRGQGPPAEVDCNPAAAQTVCSEEETDKRTFVIVSPIRRRNTAWHPIERADNDNPENNYFVFSYDKYHKFSHGIPNLATESQGGRCSVRGPVPLVDSDALGVRFAGSETGIATDTGANQTGCVRQAPSIWSAA